MNGKLYPFEVIRQAPLTLGGVTRIQTPWPLGLPYHYVDLFFEFTLNTPGSTTPGTSVVADALLAIIKSVNFFTPKNEYLWQGVPGRLGYAVSLGGFVQGQSVPRLDLATIPTAGNSTGPFGLYLRIPVASPSAADPSDFILDTSKYSAMNFDVTIGNIGDILGTPNATVISVAQLTITVYQEDTPLPAQRPATKGAAKNPNMSKYYLQYGVCNYGDPTTVGFFDLPRIADLAYFKLYVAYMTGALAAGQSGQPFGGSPGNIGNVFTDFTLQTDKNYPIKAIRAPILRDTWKAAVPTFSAQFSPNMLWEYQFPARGQKQAAFYSGDKSQLRLTWTLPGSGGPSAGDQLIVAYKAWRAAVA